MSDNDTLNPEQPIVIDSPIQGGTEEERREVEVRFLVRDLDEPKEPPRLEATHPDPTDLSATKPKRASALDALRGLFLVSMTFGFTIASNDLPVWMYHRQHPNGIEQIVDVAGISFRDLAYAAFLFTMAAALPLTMSRKIDNGEPELGIMFAAVRRWAMLLIYGLLVAHANTYFIGYSTTGRILSIVGFAIMALVFTRRRSSWDAAKFSKIKTTGWILAVAFLALTPLTYGKVFSFERIDDIMVDLAFASLVGIVLWYFTRHNITARLIALGVAVALYVGAKQFAWLQSWWYDSPLPWAYQPSRLSLLTVVIPGTIAGDMILRWMRAPATSESESAGWSRARMWGIVLLCAAFTPIVTVGLYNRWTLGTFAVCAALVIAGFFLTRNPTTPTERMVRSLYQWAAAWLMLGLVLEPMEGGIRKEPETLTYFFTVTGTTSMLLAGMSALTDGLKLPRSVQVLVDVGQNPLLMYVMFTLLLNSLFTMTPAMEDFLQTSPGISVVRSVLMTLLTVAVVRWVSHKRIYWRT
jgi:predicted acyltransferase